MFGFLSAGRSTLLAMTTAQCAVNGVHRLPEGEDSWGSEACDTLVAAALDGCQPCQDSRMDAVCESLSGDFGRLFTTWVFGLVQFHQIHGFVALPESLVNAKLLSPPSRRALRGVRLVDAMTVSGANAYRIDASRATSALGSMSPPERRAVLGDALDGIVGEIAVRHG